MKKSLIAIIAFLAVAAVPAVGSAQVSVGVGVGFGGPGWSAGVVAGYPPPVLPVYSMPPAPYPNYQWIPGYWAMGTSGYYWVPGYWTAPPAVGLYWTPGYWNYVNGAYAWNAGYWGPSVGFYGGINYGFGYFGTGFVGGYWSGGAFNYNTAVVNVNRTVIHRTFFNNTVIRRSTIVGRSRVSFNGGRFGVHARPTAAQLAVRRHAIAATAAQRAHVLAAAHTRSLLARVNHGHPRIAAVQRPLRRAPAERTVAHRAAVVHHTAAVVRYGTLHASVQRHAAATTAHHYTATHHYAASAPTHQYHFVRSGSAYRHVGMSSARARPAAAPASRGTLRAAPGGRRPPKG